MRTLALYQTMPQAQPTGQWALWEGRNAPGGISIEQALDDRLLAIRGEHMQWAAECANLKVPLYQTMEKMGNGGDEPSMWWTSLLYERHPKLSPWLYDVYKLRVLEMELARAQVDQLEFYGNERRLITAIGSLCRAMQIEFSEKPVQKKAARAHKSVIPSLYNAIPAPLRAVIRLFHWLVVIKNRFSARTSLKPGSNLPTATIVTYFPNIDKASAREGIFRSKYWESLHDILEESAKKDASRGGHFCRWLFIRFPSPDFTLSECIDLCRKFERAGRSGLSFNYLEEFLSARSILAAVARWLKLALASLIAQRNFAQGCRFKGSSLNFWSYAREQWAESFRGWRCLERCLQNIAFDNYYKIAGAQRWNLYALENCPWERMLAAKARKYGAAAPVYGGQHSTIRPTDFRYFDAPETFGSSGLSAFQPDLICVNGEGAAAQLLANGLPKDRLMVVEALRYLYLAKASRNPNKDAVDLSCHEHPTPMLIVTSFFRDETAFHLELALEAMSAGLLADYQITLKPHPYLAVDCWLNSLDPEFKSRITVSSHSLDKELAKNQIVWASNSTTASLEAAYLGLGLMVMRAKNDFDLCPVQDLPGLLRTGNLQEVESCLKNMRPSQLPEHYLDLDPGLLAWRSLLGIAQHSTADAIK